MTVIMIVIKLFNSYFKLMFQYMNCVTVVTVIKCNTVAVTLSIAIIVTDINTS